MLQEYTFTTLTAPGNSLPVGGNGNSLHTFFVTIANINTSVTIKFEGSVDKTNWANLDDEEALLTYTTNGTRKVWFTGLTKYVRVVFVSEVGGTAATIAVKYIGGRY